MSDFLKANADKIILVFLILHFGKGIADPAKRAEWGQRGADIALGALIGLVQGARLTQRKSESGNGGGGSSSSSTLELGAPAAPTPPPSIPAQVEVVNDPTNPVPVKEKP